MTENKLPEGTPGHIVEQLIGTPWGDLEVLEKAGYLLYPGTILRATTRPGQFETQPVMMRVPRGPDLRRARIQARELARAEGLDLQADKDLVDDLEITCTLAMCLRNTTEPFEPWEPDPRELDRRYDRQSLRQAWARLDALAQMIDPAPAEIGEAEMLALLSAIARDRSILPLAVYGQASQIFFIVTMASRLMSFLEAR